MQSTIRRGVTALIAVAAAAALSSCYYDPSYYSGSASVPASYGSGYGYGYGYGGSSFSTSVFVSTGNPRWGYDPYCYSYYDYHRRCYYDPYLNGYYPVGYRPPIVVGVPHPYGYRRGYCPPPRVIRNVTVVNYRDRVGAYRRTNYQWARNVQQGRPQQFSGNTRSGGRVDQFGRGDRSGPNIRQESRPNIRQNVRPNVRQDARTATRQDPRTAGRPTTNRSRTEVTPDRSQPRYAGGAAATRPNRQPAQGNVRQGRNAAPPVREEINRGNRGGEPRGNQGAPRREEQQRGNPQYRQEVRHLGQG